MNIGCGDVMMWHSVLLMVVEPNGPDYEVSLNAHILCSQQTASALLCNRHSVGFGGQQLGQSTYACSLVLVYNSTCMQLQLYLP